MVAKNISKFLCNHSILDTHKELTVELTENAEAFKYRQTKAIEEQQ